MNVVNSPDDKEKNESTWSSFSLTDKIGSLAMSGIVVVSGLLLVGGTVSLAEQGIEHTIDHEKANKATEHSMRKKIANLVKAHGIELNQHATKVPVIKTDPSIQKFLDNDFSHSGNAFQSVDVSIQKDIDEQTTYINIPLSKDLESYTQQSKTKFGVSLLPIGPGGSPIPVVVPSGKSASTVGEGLNFRVTDYQKRGQNTQIYAATNENLGDTSVYTFLEDRGEDQAYWIHVNPLDISRDVEAALTVVVASNKT